jgi:UrcA family protein
MRENEMKKFIAILVASLAVASATVSASERVVVDYSDLNLTTVSGASELYGRIVRAAHAVCHEVPLSDVHRYLMWKSCLESAVTEAVATVGSPLLTARHQREYPRRLYSSTATTK